MIALEVVEGLKEKYSNIHPLVFHRSLERAETAGELFDILDTIPDPPFAWDEESRRWRTTKDLTQSDKLSWMGR